MNRRDVIKFAAAAPALALLPAVAAADRLMTSAPGPAPFAVVLDRPFGNHGLRHDAWHA